MKKLKLLFAVIFMVAAFISCDKRFVEARLDPVSSESGILAAVYVGNQDCEDLDGEYIGSTGRLNYDQSTGTFDGKWPDGLTVTVTDNKYVSFEIDPELFPYCIGAVIVKGGNAANVYTYDPGLKSDAGLVSPINASGLPADLSNLTFCFVECEDLVIAIKSLYTDGTNLGYGVSSGTLYFDLVNGWCGDWNLGVNPYPSTSTFPMKSSNGTIIGNVVVNNGDVTITLNEGLSIAWSYLYIGTLDALRYSNLDGSGCPDYHEWIYNYIPGNSQTFDL